MTQEPPHINITDTESPIPPRPVAKAVALEYEAGVDSAPRITATGKGAIAEQILAIAFAHGVKVREDAALLDILAALEVDSIIPTEAFAAVAEILNYVYHANKVYGKKPTT
jgi:flagellar biosynthesis protein